MRSAKKRRAIRVGPFIGLSLLAHLNLLLLVVVLMSASPDGCAPERSSMAPIEVALVPRAPEKEEIAPEELDRALEEEEIKEEKEKTGQVVELTPPKEEARPEEARYLSEYDSKTEKETKAPPRPFKPGEVVGAQGAEPRRPTPSARERREIEEKAMKLAMRQDRPRMPESQVPELEEREGGERYRPRERPEVPRGEREPKIEAPEGASKPNARREVTSEDLRLSSADLSRIMGSPVNDALGDVAEGDRTLLNSRRWKYASFFNRVKRQVAEVWRPDRAYRRRDPSGNVYGFRDRMTVIRVKLNAQGGLRDLHVVQPSGVGFLDDEALAAFREAEPFPNPPRGLVDKETGLISFRFGFLFEISRTPNLRLFRYRD